MILLNHFQRAAAIDLPPRINLVQTLEFEELLSAATEHGDIGIFTAPGAIFDRLPRLAVDEDAVMS